MVDIRYHLATIVGVFLALGLGMLIGTQLAEDGTILEEQIRLAERIEAGLDRIRAENRRLSDDVKQLQERLRLEQEFADMTIGAVVAGALDAHRLALYVADAQSPTVERLGSVLKLAGASIDVHESDAPPEAAEVTPPYVVVWSDGWGDLAPGHSVWPAGGVIATPAAGPNRHAVTALEIGVDVVTDVGSPAGLLELVRKLSEPVEALADGHEEGDGR